MAKNIAELPFAEIEERVIQIGRIFSTNDKSRVRGAINDVYTREIPGKEDWNFLLASSSIACQAEYKTGVATVNTQNATVTFDSTFVVDSAYIGRKIKFSDNANVYDITAVSAASVTISPPLSGNNNISGGAFSLFQPVYALAADFDRFPKNGGLKLYQGGRVTPIPEQSIQKYFQDVTPFPSTPQSCRVLYGIGTDPAPKVEIWPPPKDPIVLQYEYLKRPVPLYSTTAGFTDMNSSGTAVVGSAGTTRFTEAGTGWFFRIDAFGQGEDSEWYRLVAITHNSSATLGVAFGLTGATTASYTMAPAPMMPARMHMAVVYGAVRSILADQNDPTVVLAGSMYNAIIQDARKLYKTRIYQQQVDVIGEEWQYRR